MRSSFLPVGLTALLLAAGCNTDTNQPEGDVSEPVQPADTAVPPGTDLEADLDPPSDADSSANAPGGFVMPETDPPVEAPGAPDEDEGASAADTAPPVAATEPPVEAPEPLVVGSTAPPLDIEHWVQDGEGKFQPVTAFEEGKVYVVEFWATWCGPCISSMPHLAETQQKYADQGVRIVSVSNEPLETVQSFLERPAPTEEDPDATFEQLTSAYSLTTDPDESVYEDYMRAADQNGIPTAFIVGKTKQVEWIGHPMQMDEPLAAIVDGSWDREAYAEQFLATQRVQETVQQAFGLARQGDTEEALAAINDALNETDLAQSQLELKQYKLQLLVGMGDRQEEVSTLGAELLDQAGDNSAAINSVTWLIYQAAVQGGVSDELVTQAIEAADVALKEMEKDERAYLLDTVAHLHQVAGNLDAAIATQQEAVDVAESRYKEQLQQYLDELKQEKANQQGEAEPKTADEEAADQDAAADEAADAADNEPEADATPQSALESEPAEDAGDAQDSTP